MSFVEEDTQLDIPEILVDREVAALALRDEHLATEGCHLDDPVYHCFTVDMVIDRLVQDIGRPLLDEELIFLSEELELDSKINPVKYGPMYLMPGDSRNRPEVTPKYTCPVSRAWR